MLGGRRLVLQKAWQAVLGVGAQKFLRPLGVVVSIMRRARRAACLIIIMRGFRFSDIVRGISREGTSRIAGGQGSRLVHAGDLGYARLILIDGHTVLRLSAIEFNNHGFYKLKY